MTIVNWQTCTRRDVISSLEKRKMIPDGNLDLHKERVVETKYK
jgi:hypothetical protein